MLRDGATSLPAAIGERVRLQAVDTGGHPGELLGRVISTDLGTLSGVAKAEITFAVWLHIRELWGSCDSLEIYQLSRSVLLLMVC